MDLSATISKSLSTSLMPGPSSKTQKDKRISTKPDTTVLAAVALQDHIIRNLQLQNHSLSDTFKTKERNKMNCYRLVNRNTVKPVVDTGIKRNEKKEIKEDEEREYVLDPKPSGLTLAQKMGLVEAPNAPLTANEWHLVKKRSMQQGDSAQPCAICREEFGLQQQVLLSCSHVFHRICLQAFEKFSGRRSCPMCRKEQYQTRVIHDGARLYRMKCATRIQSHWRGYIVRKWYKQLRHTVPPKDKKLRKRFYEDKAIQRETFDCPICITPLDHLSNILYQAEGPGRGEKSGSLVRQTVLLSCSHTFHYACLQAFEDFSEGENHICPLCRSTYEKKVLSNKL
ncbi:RING finger protein 32 isoform X2 [Hypanus sabinus]|uniref:RING finger protein 32 isoform X2 n=1 Tax=Hypanus sabinus TaxID=79690 RepID=UPI0028C3A00C|nr:RING finger protein 32 isoform X2 [Hypanus sabinus]